MRPPLLSGPMLLLALGGCLVFARAAAITVVPGPILISRAWAPAPARRGDATQLYMTITNNGAVPDDLVRARCPFASAAVTAIVDGGGKAAPARAVPAIPVPARKTVALEPDGWHIALGQTTQPLRAGQILGCTITFRKAGERLVEVTIARPGARSYP